MTPARRLLNWSVPLAVWLLFSWWYTNTAGPLSEAEVEHYLSDMESRGQSPEIIDTMRRLLDNDTGDDLVVFNLIEKNDRVPALAGLPAGATADDAIGKYMEHMFPALLLRACHPVVLGTTATNAIDIWGIDNATSWSQGAVMRYRSRRDLIEIAANPDFSGPHEFKIAGMKKTIAVPLDPWTSTGDPRLLLGMLLLIVALLLDRRR